MLSRPRSLATLKSVNLTKQIRDIIEQAPPVISSPTSTSCSTTRSRKRGSWHVRQQGHTVSCLILFERTSARTSTTTHAMSTWSNPLTELHSPCLFHVKRAAVSMKRTVAARPLHQDGGILGNHPGAASSPSAAPFRDGSRLRLQRSSHEGDPLNVDERPPQLDEGGQAARIRATARQHSPGSSTAGSPDATECVLRLPLSGARQQAHPLGLHPAPDLQCCTACISDTQSCTACSQQNRRNAVLHSPWPATVLHSLAQKASSPACLACFCPQRTYLSIQSVARREKHHYFF